jgi:hypothetical protein
MSISSLYVLVINAALQCFAIPVCKFRKEMRIGYRNVDIPYTVTNDTQVSSY